MYSSRYAQLHAVHGIRVIRVFAHTDGYGFADNIPTPEPIQPELGVFNEKALQRLVNVILHCLLALLLIPFRTNILISFYIAAHPVPRLDLVLAAAASSGIRLHLVFTNFEPFYGGIQVRKRYHPVTLRFGFNTPTWVINNHSIALVPVQWYVEQTLGKGHSKNLFYTNSDCKKAYKNYVRMLIERKNTITGVHYKDDPTIFAWDLMNEVRSVCCWNVEDPSSWPGQRTSHSPFHCPSPTRPTTTS